jgi:hypothetical protein
MDASVAWNFGIICGAATPVASPCLSAGSNVPPSIIFIIIISSSSSSYGSTNDVVPPPPFLD